GRRGLLALGACGLLDCLAAVDATAAATPTTLARGLGRTVLRTIGGCRGCPVGGRGGRLARGVAAFSGRTRGARRLRAALAPTFARAGAPAAAAARLDAAARVVGRALLARLAEDLADALAFGGLSLHAFARLARQRDQQVLGDRLGGDLLVDVGLDVRQAHRVALAGEADRIALGAQARGAADAVHVVLGVER